MILGQMTLRRQRRCLLWSGHFAGRVGARFGMKSDWPGAENWWQQETTATSFSICSGRYGYGVVAALRRGALGNRFSTDTVLGPHLDMVGNFLEEALRETAACIRGCNPVPRSVWNAARYYAVTFSWDIFRLRLSARRKGLPLMPSILEVPSQTGTDFDRSFYEVNQSTVNSFRVSQRSDQIKIRSRIGSDRSDLGTDRQIDPGGSRSDRIIPEDS